MLPPNIDNPCNRRVMKNESTPSHLKFHNLAGYELGHQIGQGRWGTVRLLIHTADPSVDQVAIKLVDDNAKRRNQLINEFKIVTKLNQLKKYNSSQFESVVTYYQLFACPDTRQLGLSMEYLVGDSIYSHIEHVDKLENDLRQLLSVVSDLHSYNIVHRDIKCDNVIITNGGQRLKLIDFNLAVALSVNPSESYLLNGTAKHYSPELIEWKQIREKHTSPTKLVNLLKKADVWAIGLMFYKLVSQTLAFTGNSIIEIHSKVRLGQFTQLPNDSVMNQVINLCLTTNYRERPSASELHQMLTTKVNNQVTYNMCNIM